MPLCWQQHSYKPFPPTCPCCKLSTRKNSSLYLNALFAMAILPPGLQTCGLSYALSMAGRFLLRFGSAMMSSPQYVAEVAPTHLRGRLVGFYGACFQVGSLCVNAALIGFSKIDGNWSWRIPLLLEALFPLIVCTTIYLWTPESPRYLILRGKKEQAKRVIARYQTTEGNNLDYPLVSVLIRQIEESLENETSNREL
jgi:hypothetical protein